MKTLQVIKPNTLRGGKTHSHIHIEVGPGSCEEMSMNQHIAIYTILQP